MDPTERARPPLTGDETATLRGFLDHHRDTLRWKASGLDAEGLDTPLPPSDLTLGGLLKHMAYVEDNWFSHVLLGRDRAEPWRSAPWDDDRDWELTSAAADSPEGLRRLFDEAVAASDAALDEALAEGGLERLSVGLSRSGSRFGLRWILVHMIEEYARHNGHADLIRQAVDGETGA